MPDGNRTHGSDDGPERSPLQERERVQLFLAKYHGLTTAVVEDNIVPTRLAGSIGAAHPGISLAHGRVQDSLNSGDHDEALATSSLAGAQFDQKELGYLHNLNRYYTARRNDPANLDERAGWAARALRWGNIVVGSVSSELDKVKGVEFIKEGGEVLLNAVEEFIAHKDSEDESIRPPSVAAGPPANPEDVVSERPESSADRPAKNDRPQPGTQRARGGGRRPPRSA
jgi:hypothetical protein